MLARLCLALCLAVVLTPSASAQRFQPGSPYICPNISDTGLDCYLDAVVHLYRMCMHVKSIEIIEFGYEKAQEGVNGAKSEYCVDKQKINITRPYQAALREATPWRDAIDNLRGLQQYWLDSMVNLRWQNGEPGEDYNYRVQGVIDELSFRVDAVRVSFSTATDRAAAVPAVAAKPKAGKPRTTAAAKPN